MYICVTNKSYKQETREIFSTQDWRFYLRMVNNEINFQRYWIGSILSVRLKVIV